MNQQEFEKLSSDLRVLATEIPLHWGAVQNNQVDDQINMFKITTYEQLKTCISNLDQDSRNYLKRRWYIWMCSKCDEYLFYKNNNVEKNPNIYDKAWDIKINGSLTFDIKGTVIPKSFRNNVNAVINNPSGMIDFFYDEQSKGRRYDIQNRLFVVHHSFVAPERELYLRCDWKPKELVYSVFCKECSNINFYHTHGVYAGVIFILEKEVGKVESIISR